MSELKVKLNPEILHSLGLDTHKIARHYEKIHQVLHGQFSSFISILETCSVQNGHVLSWDAVQGLIKNLSKYAFYQLAMSEECFNWVQKYVVTCIPAAGAASRYWQGIPPDREPYYECPKALLPATLEGDTFLDIKLIEQKKLMPTKANVLVVPLGFKEKFEQYISSAYRDISSRSFTPETIQPEWLILEQTQNLSTIRFHLDGTPYLMDGNIYSPVPAGHGELLHVFDDILAAFPHSCALHLRNLDNIIGTQDEQVQELSVLAQTFYYIRSALDVVRKQVKKFIDNPDLAMGMQNSVYLSAVNFLKDCCSDLVPKIDSENMSDWENTLHALNKPLSIFGVVKREQGDQGGGPVIAKMSNGNVVKICIEMAHVTEATREEYFGSSGKLAYFNPVLVFFETQTASGIKTDFKSLFNDNFWLLSKRHYLDLPMCYHETALYELIGNSEKTNLVFVEVPRTLFRPHKYFSDSANKTRQSYGI